MSTTISGMTAAESIPMEATEEDQNVPYFAHTLRKPPNNLGRSEQQSMIVPSGSIGKVYALC